MTLPNFIVNNVRNIIDICVLYILFYGMLRLLRGTRAMHVLRGMVFLGVILFVAQWLELYATSWLLEKFWPALVVAIVILFQPELRRGLAQIGQRRLFGKMIHEEFPQIDAIVEAAHALSLKKVGALIAIEREADLKTIKGKQT